MQIPYSEKTILIGEVESDARCGLQPIIESLGYSVLTAGDGDGLLSVLRTATRKISAVVLDLPMQGRVGIEILRDIRSLDSSLPVIMVSGVASTLEVVEAMKSGATDFLCKPITDEEVERVLTGVPKSGVPSSTSGPRSIPSPTFFTGASSQNREIQARIRQIGLSGAPVVIQGETGSGKEVLARELHCHSARATRPFLKLNCAALPSELVESELFGYERGAFSGAFQKKPGMFELADGGTILLDEIGDMDVRLQAKLLQVLQDQEFRRVGGKDIVKVDVRIMAATHRDLDKAIQAGSFREDLYYRLSVITLHVPSLRERREDIIPIGEFLIRKYVVPGGAVPLISLNLRQAMLAYPWPGNVRELENYMRKLVIFHDPDLIARELEMRINRVTAMSVRAGESRVATMGAADSSSPLEQVTKENRQAETEAILAALNSTHWNRKQAASVLKVDYKSLLYKMKKLRIDDSPVSLSERSPGPVHQNARVANGD